MTTGNDTPQEHRLIVAGFGGQGILTLGRLLCLAGMSEGKQVTYLPSYGSEVRGGTANCNVVVSNSEIFSTVVEQADSLVILNGMSFERFGDSLRRGGLMVLNTSLVAPGSYAADHEAQVLEVPATDRAGEMGKLVVANVIMLGAFLGVTGLCKEASIIDALKQTLTGRKSSALELNVRALAEGMEIARAQAP